MLQEQFKITKKGTKVCMLKTSVQHNKNGFVDGTIWCSNSSCCLQWKFVLTARHYHSSSVVNSLVMPVHTSCECKCDATFYFTNVQQTIQKSWAQLNYSWNIRSEKHSYDVKFTLHFMHDPFAVSWNYTFCCFTMAMLSMSCSCYEGNAPTVQTAQI